MSALAVPDFPAHPRGRLYQDDRFEVTELCGETLCAWYESAPTEAQARK